VFYAYGVVLAVRIPVLAGFLADGAGDELARIILGWVALYAAAVVLPRMAAEPGRRALRHFDRRLGSSPAAVAGLAVVLALVSLSLLAPLLASADPVTSTSPATTRYAAPSAQHLLGTDRLGRDIWARLLYGARASLGIAVLAVLLSALIGAAYGALAGLASRRVDEVMMRVVDGLLAFPRLVFVLTLVALFSNSVGLLVVAIAVTGWMGPARLVRGEVVRIRERDFVAAALATGVSRARLIGKHLMPNAAGPLIVAATLNVGGVILLESYLSFLGLGIAPPAPSWGSMVFEGRDMLVDAWWVAAAPAAAITIAVVAFNLIGDGLRDALETKP
jgi:peptide/nickel transport system permease protein